MPCFTGRREEMASAAPSRAPGQKITFAPSDEIEALRPFIDQFWSTILETSYTTSFVSNKSTFDAWEHYVGGRAELIKRVEHVYGVDITPFYSEPIPGVLHKIREGAEKIHPDIDKLHARRYAFQEPPMVESDKQKLMREHHLGFWPDYRGFTCTTALVYVPLVILGILWGGVAAKLSYNHWYTLLGMFLFFALCFLGVEVFFMILNLPIRKQWEAQIGKVISWAQVETLIEDNTQAWTLIAAPKISGSSSFGTYQSFGYGWDAILLLNTHSSEHFVVRGKWGKIESLAEKRNLRAL